MFRVPAPTPAQRRHAVEHYEIRRYGTFSTRAITVACPQFQTNVTENGCMKRSSIQWRVRAAGSSHSLSARR